MMMDVIGIDFIFKQKKFETGLSQTPASFENWVEHGDLRAIVWGVDPGVTDVFVAADGITKEESRFRKCSSKEYYSICGFKDARRKSQVFKTSRTQNSGNL
jgi:hypothetical protein